MARKTRVFLDIIQEVENKDWNMNWHCGTLDVLTESLLGWNNGAKTCLNHEKKEIFEARKRHVVKRRTRSCQSGVLLTE